MVVNTRICEPELCALVSPCRSFPRYKIWEVSPDLVERSLMVTLTQTLTRSVTHAMVPTLSKALTHTYKQDQFCYYCYYYHTYCNFCHYSAQSAYYDNYYSTYYSDYYSDYYANYYWEAYEQLDAYQHPLSHPAGEKGPAGKEQDGVGFFPQEQTEAKAEVAEHTKGAGGQRGWPLYKYPQHGWLNDGKPWDYQWLPPNGQVKQGRTARKIITRS